MGSWRLLLLIMDIIITNSCEAFVQYPAGWLTTRSSYYMAAFMLSRAASFCPRDLSHCTYNPIQHYTQIKRSWRKLIIFTLQITNFEDNKMNNICCNFLIYIHLVKSFCKTWSSEIGKEFLLQIPCSLGKVLSNFWEEKQVHEEIFTTFQHSSIRTYT